MNSSSEIIDQYLPLIDSNVVGMSFSVDSVINWNARVSDWCLVYFTMLLQSYITSKKKANYH